MTQELLTSLGFVFLSRTSAIVELRKNTCKLVSTLAATSTNANWCIREARKIKPLITAPDRLKKIAKICRRISISGASSSTGFAPVVQRFVGNAGRGQNHIIVAVDSKIGRASCRERV